jgi:hypothetical protein
MRGPEWKNMAIHGPGADYISVDEAREFIALARGVVEKLKSLGKTDDP